MVSNGYVPSSDLVTVQSGIQLSRPTANAWFRMAGYASAHGHRIGIAAPAGGYRSYYTQQDMKKRPWLYNLNKQSSKKLAPAGSSTHGYGTRVDVVGDVAWVIAHGREWGFWREFGAADPNHFAHDGVTAITTSPKPPAQAEQDIEMLPRIYALKGSANYKTLLVGRNGVFSATDIRTGKPLSSGQVVEINKFLQYDSSYYPNGKLGAAVFADSNVETVIVGALTGVKPGS